MKTVCHSFVATVSYFAEDTEPTTEFLSQLLGDFMTEAPLAMKSKDLLQIAEDAIVVRNEQGAAVRLFLVHTIERTTEAKRKKQKRK